MKSNVEINLFQKKIEKEERKRRKWIHQILQKGSKLKSYQKYSHSSEQCGLNRSCKTERKTDSETGYDITNMDNTLNNREREEGEKSIPKN